MTSELEKFLYAILWKYCIGVVKRMGFVTNV